MSEVRNVFFILRVIMMMHVLSIVVSVKAAMVVRTVIEVISIIVVITVVAVLVLAEIMVLNAVVHQVVVVNLMVFPVKTFNVVIIIMVGVVHLLEIVHESVMVVGRHVCHLLKMGSCRLCIFGTCVSFARVSTILAVITVLVGASKPHRVRHGISW